jgi:CheY-like chemotaxis protein
MLRRLIGEDIELSWKPCRDLWKVKMDPAQVDQILVNLVVNARDAIDGVGMITVESEKIVVDETYRGTHPDFQIGRYVMLAVNDNGMGMDSNTIERIFEPFFTTKTDGKGSGLGLATVFGIVKQNSGFINVYSEPSNGTIFKIYLPCIDELATELAKEIVEMPMKGWETILVVEDEPSILQLSRSLLEEYGYTVLSALSPKEALTLVERHKGEIHLLITDVVMPGMNGRELRDQLSARRPGIKVLFMSGYTADVIAHQGILEEGIQFLQKPFSMVTLAVKVRKVLDETAKGA